MKKIGALQSHKRFPPHLNSVSTLPCELSRIFVKIPMVKNTWSQQISTYLH